MQVIEIPFVKLVGIEDENSTLFLNFKHNVKNHIETIHASAQFTLAETQSGVHLQKLFPELVGKVVPVLRDAQIKYKKPALKKIFAYASCTNESIDKFKEQFDKKGRGSILVSVEIKDVNGVVTSQGFFNWFVQTI